jgi:sporulation protein YlmC with PRC-barrel domain
MVRRSAVPYHPLVTEFRVGAEVHGSDGLLGKVDALIVDPTLPAVTHLVVVHELLVPRRLVPVLDVRQASPDRIDVELDGARFEQCPHFDEPAFNASTEASVYGGMAFEAGTYFLEPYATPLDGWALAEHERIPKGEISIRRGDEVVSSDGTRLGHVDEFLVDPADGHITHVVLRQGHVFRHDEDIVIPVRSATRFDEGRVVLDIDVADVDELPKIPVQRHRHVER